MAGGRVALLSADMDDDSAGRLVRDLGTWLTAAAPGARLPSTRTLVQQHGVSPVTVQKALRTLEARGLVETRPGVGTFARTLRTPRPADLGWQTAALRAPHARVPVVSGPMRGALPDAIALHAGYPDRALLPERLVRAALGRAARSEVALARPEVTGLPALREWFASEIARDVPPAGAPPAPRDVLVVPGSQSGLGSVFRAVVGHGRPLVVESPTYWGAIVAAAQAGVRVVPVPSGPGGPDPDALARAFEETGARAFYAQPHHANPTGAQWSPATSEAVLAVVQAHDAFLVEDDWAHDFGIDGDVRPVVASDDAGHVIYLRSLTKSVSPGLRVAAVVARGAARERLLADQAAESMYVSGVLQAAALDVVTQPGWGTHLRRLRQQLRVRRDLLVDALVEHAPDARVEHVPAGGLNLWVRLPEGTDVDRVVRGCEAAGVLVAPGHEWFPAEPPAAYVRLNYAGPAPERFGEGARVLGRVLAEVTAPS